MKLNTSFIIFSFALCVAISNSESISDTSDFRSLLRKINPERKLQSVVTENKTYQCKTFTNNTCTCYKPCMIPKGETGDCIIKKCYTYDSNLDQCQNNGQSQVSTILMHIFLGFFGGGVGFIHNWFWFGIWWGIIGGTLIMICSLFCCLMKNENSDESGVACCSQCITCLFSCVLLGFWIYFLVMICNKEFLDKNGCKLV